MVDALPRAAAWFALWLGRDALPRVRRCTSIEREQAHKKGGNKHKGLERFPDVQRRTRGSASLSCKSFYEFFLGDHGSLAALHALTSVAKEVSAPQEFFGAGLIKDNG